MKRLILALGVGLLALAPYSKSEEAAAAPKPARVILLIVDGLHYDAIERLDLNHIRKLGSEGTRFREAWIPLPDHPLSGPWRAMHTTSVPNPVMLAGSVFLESGHRMLQNVCPGLSAILSNDGAYQSLEPGFSTVFRDQSQTLPDAAVLKIATWLLEERDYLFLRIHLQDTGRGGHHTRNAKTLPWARNIWHPGSPYRKGAITADRVIDEFCEKLKAMGKWDDTLLVLTADHGQSSKGTHPPLEREGWITPLMFIGPGIAKGRVYDYAEGRDIIPTICRIMGWPLPVENGGTGRVLAEVFEQEKSPENRSPRNLQKLNEDLLRYASLVDAAKPKAQNDPGLASALAQAEKEVMTIDRFTRWPESGSLEKLIETNHRAIEALRAALERSGK